MPGLTFYSFLPCPSQTLIASDLSCTSSLSSTAELAEGDAAHGRRPPVGAAASHEGGAIPWTSSLDTPRLSDGQPPVLCILLPFPSLSFLSAEPHAPPNCALPLQVRPSLIWMARATYSGLAQEYPSKCTVFPARLPRASLFLLRTFQGGSPFRHPVASRTLNLPHFPTVLYMVVYSRPWDMLAMPQRRSVCYWQHFTQPAASHRITDADPLSLALILSRSGLCTITFWQSMEFG